jgi:hypothetical protein
MVLCDLEHLCKIAKNIVLKEGRKSKIVVGWSDWPETNRTHLVKAVVVNELRVALVNESAEGQTIREAEERKEKNESRVLEEKRRKNRREIDSYLVSKFSILTPAYPAVFVLIHSRS